MRGLAVAPLVLAMSSNCFADQKLCASVQQTPSTGLFGLYYHTHGSPAWASADNVYSGAGALSLTRGEVDFALVVSPFTPRSGVVDIRLRTEANGSQQDASRVLVHREAVYEPCAPGGRYYRLRAYSSEIPTGAYEDYHDPNLRVDYSDLDRFHFSYKPDTRGCVNTNDADRRSSFRFSSIPNEFPTGTASGDMARAVNPPPLNTPVAFISGTISRAAAAVLPSSHAATVSPNSPPQPTHYTKLVSLLRKYDSRSIGQDCIGFSLVPSANEIATYVSITDFDAAPYLSSSFFANHWKINWQNR